MKKRKCTPPSVLEFGTRVRYGTESKIRGQVKGLRLNVNRMTAVTAGAWPDFASITNKSRKQCQHHSPADTIQNVCNFRYNLLLLFVELKLGRGQVFRGLVSKLVKYLLKM
ncbi:hypothetical protein Trydic_g10023 [Trypoxylus dichotomus]